MRPGDHGFLAAVLKQGMRAVTVGVDAVSGTAGLIWPGDRVDVILTQSMDDPKLPPGRRVAAETVLQDARVIAIDQVLVQGGVPDAPDTAGRPHGHARGDRRRGRARAGGHPHRPALPRAPRRRSAQPRRRPR